jgi:two-component system LytT family sensor kinase
LPQYSSKDYHVMMLVMLPFTLLLNSILFGRLYFSNLSVFVLATLITATAACIDFIACGYIAVFMKKRYPNEKQLAKKLTLMILSFFVVTGLFLSTLFHGYEAIGFYDYTFYEKGFIWSYLAMAIVNVFLTLLHEGISRYDDWRANLKETDTLHNAYRKSQLLALKSQVNPHFLFNSLNSLSSLINENEQEAEKFLDEMSKVYRYMLRNDDDHLVSVQTELTFTDSYMYLLKARYGEGLKVFINIKDVAKSLCLPPLSLQVVIENAIYQNTISKSCPLYINICADNTENIVISNNVQPKQVTDVMDHEEGLDNLVNKYRLLNNSTVIIKDSGFERRIKLPLLKSKKEEVPV